MNEEFKITTASILEITAREAAEDLRNKDARIAELSKAIGLLTTLKPAMEIDVNNPVCMAKEIVTHIDARIAELEAALDTVVTFLEGNGGACLSNDDLVAIRAKLNGEKKNAKGGP